MSTQIAKAGSAAPRFCLKAMPDQSVSLADFRGRPVILAFYPADWSPVCSDQLAVHNEVIDELRCYDAQLLGIPLDGVWRHLAFANKCQLHFPLLADFEPKTAVARAYGAYDTKNGMCERALFVIDREGVIAWNYLSPVGVTPGTDGILDALGHVGWRTRSAPAREAAHP